MFSHELASYMLGGHICFSLAAAETETDFSQDKNFCQVPAGDYPDINQLWVRSFLASLFLPMNINHLATTAGTIQVFYFSISLFIPPFLNCPLSESPPTMDESHVCRVCARARSDMLLQKVGRPQIQSVKCPRRGGWIFGKYSKFRDLRVRFDSFFLSNASPPPSSIRIKMSPQPPLDLRGTQ